MVMWFGTLGGPQTKTDSRPESMASRYAVSVGHEKVKQGPRFYLLSSISFYPLYFFFNFSPLAFIYFFLFVLYSAYFPFYFHLF